MWAHCVGDDGVERVCTFGDRVADLSAVWVSGLLEQAARGAVIFAVLVLLSFGALAAYTVGGQGR